MKYLINNEYYEVKIIRKNNKNTYIKINESLQIVVTTNYLSSDKYILSLLDQNKQFLESALLKQQKKQNNDFCYLGNKYDLVYISNLQDVDIDKNKIYLKDDNQLKKWLDKIVLETFKNHLDIIYQSFNNIPYPKLKIRKMKTRWGVCNRKTNTVTLNYELIKYDLTKLDYVIVHELCHFIHFNHSASFWNEVSKYCPNYKKIRKELRE